MKVYKTLLWLVITVLSCSQCYSQDIGNTVPEQFATKFQNQAKDLVRLRDFLESKDSEYSNLRAENEKLSKVYVADSLLFKKRSQQLQDFLKTHGDTQEFFPASDVPVSIRTICTWASTGDINTISKNNEGVITYNIRKASDDIEGWIADIHHKVIITKSLENVSKDREAAYKAIQSIYNVESGTQDYKTKISLYFAGIISVLIIISFLFLFIKSSPAIGNDFLNGNGLQFIALFAIIISVILFGILGILEGKELSAILSGISGFILGKGLNVNLVKKQNENTPQ